MFSRIFIERPRLAAVVSLILLLAGGISLANLPVAEYPEIAPPTLFVSATYSGASADVVAQTVAMPLENEINGVEDLLYFSSTSSNSGSYSCSVTSGPARIPTSPSSTCKMPSNGRRPSCPAR